MKVVVILNTGAGSVAGGAIDPATIRAAFHDAGAEADVLETPGTDLATVALAAAAGEFGPVDAVVAAGGDGTASAVAGALAGGDVPFGVLPVGTLNHFAKDLGMPLTPAEAAQVIAAGNVRRVDVAEVNGRTFVNNASIGLYPHIVSNRDRQRERLGRGKWLAMLVATVAVFRRFPEVEVVLNTADVAVRRRTPFVFVGNNPYDVTAFQVGGRPRLDTGALGVYFTRRTGRLGLLLLALRALVGRLNHARDFDSLARAELRIDTRKKTLRIALDGEVTRLVPPLEFRIRPGALRVIAP